jgi:DNA-binding SARP family transcriptional activator
MGARIRLCGRLEIELDGQRVERRLPGRQGPLILAVLVLNRSRPVGRHELIDALWPTELPADPDESLSALLSKLRLAVGKDTLTGRRELTLALPPDAEVDVEQAFAEAERAQAALAAGEFAAAREAASLAVEITGRGFLVGLDAPWVEDRRREIDELRLDALGALAHAGVTLGGGHLAGAERAARELVRAAPLREAGHRLLMEALAARGEIAEALAAYEELRVLLRDELGTAPGEAVRALHERLLAGEPSGKATGAATREPLPLPALLAPRWGWPFVGRERELGRLWEAWADASSGRSRLVLLCGGPGIGKTRLAGELAQRAHGEGAVLYAGCQEDALVPYQPFVEAVRPYVRSGWLDGARGALGPGEAELARLIPELPQPAPEGRAVGPDDPETRRYLLFEAVSSLLIQVCAGAPVLLVLDDLHWADRPTLQLLRHVLRSQREAPLLVVGSYREAEVAPGGPLFELLADLRRDGLFERLSLEGLDERGVRALIASHAGEAAPRELTQRVHARTEGNPFFVEEVVRDLLEASVLSEREGLWISARTPEEIGVPDGVKEVIGYRLARLSEGCRGMLSAASVLGREFRFDLLVSMVDADDESLIGALEEALRAQLVTEYTQEPGTYAFTHALVRETLYGALSAPRRQRVHAAAALALAAETPATSPTELAHHWRQARRLPEALASSLAAAEAAEKVYASAEAHHHLEYVLQIWDRVADAEQRTDFDLAGVIARTAENAFLTFELARAIALARKAVELVEGMGDPVRAALAYVRLGHYLWADGAVDEALESSRMAVELMPAEPPSAELAQVLAAHGQILMLRGRRVDSRPHCERAISVARRVGARAEECHALNTLGVDVAALGDRRLGIAHIVESKEIAEELGWIDAIGRAYVNLAELLDEDGRPRESAELTLEGVEATRRLGAVFYVVSLESELALRLLRLGRLEEAAQALERGRAAGPSGFTEGVYDAGEAELACIRGELEAADQAARRARGTLGATRDSMYFGPTTAIAVAVQLAAGRAAQAVVAFEQGLDAMLADEEHAQFVARLYARGVRAYADVAERAREPDEVDRVEGAAAAAVERFDAVIAPERFPEGDPPPLPLAYRAVIEAELSRLRGRGNPSLWRRAAERWLDLDEPLELAYAQWRQAEALLRAGEGRHEAGELLASAAASVRDIGAAALLGEIEALASRNRLRLPDSSPTATRSSASACVPR